MTIREKGTSRALQRQEYRSLPPQEAARLIGYDEFEEDVHRVALVPLRIVQELVEALDPEERDHIARRISAYAIAGAREYAGNPMVVRKLAKRTNLKDWEAWDIQRKAAIATAERQARRRRPARRGEAHADTEGPPPPDPSFAQDPASIAPWEGWDGMPDLDSDPMSETDFKQWANRIHTRDKQASPEKRKFKTGESDFTAPDSKQKSNRNRTRDEHVPTGQADIDGSIDTIEAPMTRTEDEDQEFQPVEIPSSSPQGGELPTSTLLETGEREPPEEEEDPVDLPAHLRARLRQADVSADELRGRTASEVAARWKGLARRPVLRQLLKAGLLLAPAPRELGEAFLGAWRAAWRDSRGGEDYVGDRARDVRLAADLVAQLQVLAPHLPQGRWQELCASYLYRQRNGWSWPRQGGTPAPLTLLLMLEQECNTLPPGREEPGPAWRELHPEPEAEAEARAAAWAYPEPALAEISTDEAPAPRSNPMLEGLAALGARRPAAPPADEDPPPVPPDPIPDPVPDPATPTATASPAPRGPPVTCRRQGGSPLYAGELLERLDDDTCRVWVPILRAEILADAATVQPVPDEDPDPPPRPGR